MDYLKELFDFFYSLFTFCRNTEYGLKDKQDA